MEIDFFIIVKEYAKNNDNWVMGILVWVVVAIVFLAILGLGWDTFFAGVKKGADKLGITSIVENATNSATEIAKNASRDIVGSSLGKQ
jgi:hypothetical protein